MNPSRQPLALALAGLVLPAFPLAQTAFPPGAQKPQGLVVRTLPGYGAAAFAEVLGATLAHSDPVQGRHLLHLPNGAAPEDAEDLARFLSTFPVVLYSEPDEPTDPPEIGNCGPHGETVGAQQCTIAIIDGTPTEESFAEQNAFAMINAEDAHVLATGTPQVVAVVDTGVDLSHPHLANNLYHDGHDLVDLSKTDAQDVGDGIDGDNDGLVDEAVGHGTHVAGLVLLSDPDALILPIRALDSDGLGNCFQVAQAVYTAVDDGASVINLSLSMRTQNDTLAEALMYAEHHGVTVVSSAGNADEGVLFPANFDMADFPHLDPLWLPAGTVLTGDHVIAVAGVDEAKVKAGFSCYGQDADISAPAVDVYSSQMDGEWAWWSGTSMSSGVVAGSVSFLLSIWDQGSHGGTALDLMGQTALDLDPLNPGYTGQLGAGLLDLGKAAETLLD